MVYSLLVAEVVFMIIMQNDVLVVILWVFPSNNQLFVCMYFVSIVKNRAFPCAFYSLTNSKHILKFFFTTDKNENKWDWNDAEMHIQFLQKPYIQTNSCIQILAFASYCSPAEYKMEQQYTDKFVETLTLSASICHALKIAYAFFF